MNPSNDSKGSLNSNLHVHTPHSFSYFPSISALLHQAAKEGISVLGINDFYTTEGYDEFTNCCRLEKIFPAYGVEVIALHRDDQKRGILSNDPHNPGRVYLCGKGLIHPLKKGRWEASIIERIKKASQLRIRNMIEKLNRKLKKEGIAIELFYEKIRKKTPSGWIQERHIARELFHKIDAHRNKNDILKVLCGDEKLKSSEESSSIYEKKLRDNLLKAGKPAYVEEEENAFLSMKEAGSLFLKLGGIPVYPILADGAKNLTHWEKNPFSLAKRLEELGYFAVEFIPHRNTLSILTEYVKILDKEGFVITQGSEHNTSERLPLAPVSKDSPNLPDELLKIFWEGCCIIAAHQYLKSIGEDGFVDEKGKRTKRIKEELRQIGEVKITSQL